MLVSNIIYQKKTSNIPQNPVQSNILLNTIAEKIIAIGYIFLLNEYMSPLEKVSRADLINITLV